VRDNNLLESALQAPFQTFGGDELYPTIQKKAACLCYGLVNNHSFIDEQADRNIGHDDVSATEWEVGRLY